MIRVHGCSISYYTGKLEAYLRYRGVDYERLPTFGYQREIKRETGAVQMPIVHLEDGRWMSDSTPIIAWFEAQQQAASIYPDDPALRFVSLLLEDYADEYLWRPAMHYRWSYQHDREYASGAIVDDMLGDFWPPRWVKKLLIAQRQRRGFVRGDGVTKQTWDHVEQGYLSALDRLEAIFALRPFILGDAPTIADFGFMGPMLRHFGQDPTPAEIMRTHAPGVYEWVARMWNTRARTTAPELLSEIDAPLADLLGEACETHLVQLRENAAAFGQGHSRYDQEIQGCLYERVPSSRYRVFCLEQLRRQWACLDDKARADLRQFLPEPHACVLWDDRAPVVSEYDPEHRAPFNRAINVFGHGVPR